MKQSPGIMTLAETGPDSVHQQKAHEYGGLLRHGLFLELGISVILLLALLELGHHCHHDTAKLMAIQAVAFLLAFYLANLTLKVGIVLFSFQGITDVAALPWFILVLAMFILMFQPLLNWYNRHIELTADKVALELSKSPKAFINLMTKLTDQNLSEADPSRWAEFLFYDHPTYNERVKLAYEYS